MMMPDKIYQDSSTTTRFGFNGMEREDEIAGLGNSLNFGARQYDSRTARFSKLDRFKNKFHNLTPYAFAANTPINGIDKNGDSLYILAYADDVMFREAAMTRRRDIMGSGNYDWKRDRILMIDITSLKAMVDEINASVSELKNKYGETVEFGLWSHSSAKDGSIGDEANPPEYQVPGYGGEEQLNFKGWKELEFNWSSSSNNRALFYGCNSSSRDLDHVDRFTTRLSKLDNFKDVTLYGQITSAYPSIYTDSYNVDLIYKVAEKRPLAGGFDVYFVGREYGIGDGLEWDEHILNGLFGKYPSYKMELTRNGEFIGFDFQPRDKDND